MSKLISVIIPAFNDAARLQLCLQGLAQQTYPDFEVVVVDNGSKDVVAHRKVCEVFDFVTFTIEEKPGSYAARNRGLELAKGDTFAFTDSDCLPVPQWLEAGAASLVDGNGLVAGRVEIFPASLQHPSAVELYEMVFAFPQQEYVEKYGYGVTANMFTTRAVIDVVGNFNAELMSGGDRDFGERVRAAGFDSVYSAEACVRHPARRTTAELKKKVKRTLGGLRDRDSSPSHALNLLKEFLKPPVKLSINMLKDTTYGFTLNQKLKVCGVATHMRYLMAKETLSLWLGQSSSNRA